MKSAFCDIVLSCTQLPEDEAIAKLTKIAYYILKMSGYHAMLSPKCRTRLFICILVTIIAFSPLGSRGDNSALAALGSDQRYPESQSEIINLLRNKDFSKIDAYLHRYQTAYERDINAESALIGAYGIFTNLDPALEPLIDEWVRKYPASYAARQARGSYLISKAYRARGTKYASETTEQQFRAMEEVFSYAEQDLEEAIRLYPKCLTAYIDLITINRTSSTSVMARNYLDEGLRIHPDSLQIRAKYLHYLQPKWGGTDKELDELMMELETSSRTYPKLRVLKGYRDFIHGTVLSDQQNHYEALQYFLKALGYGDYYVYSLGLAGNYSQLRKYNEAISTIDKAFQKGTLPLEALSQRAYAYKQLGKFDEALQDIDHGLILSPGNEYLIDLRTYCTKLRGGEYRIESSFVDQSAIKQKGRTYTVLPIRHTVPWLNKRPVERDAVINRNMEKVDRMLTDLGLLIAGKPMPRGQEQSGLSGQQVSQAGQLPVSDTIVETTLKDMGLERPGMVFYVTINIRAISKATEKVLWQAVLMGRVTDADGKMNHLYALDNIETKLYAIWQAELKKGLSN